jgi:hypothetical protein
VEPTVDQIIAERSEVEGATWESCTEGLDGEPLFIAISWLVGCARCHGDGHPNLIFVRLRHPVEENDGTLLTHWTACPKTGEPILMGTQ